MYAPNEVTIIYLIIQSNQINPTKNIAIINWLEVINLGICFTQYDVSDKSYGNQRSRQERDEKFRFLNFKLYFCSDVLIHHYSK